MTTNHVAVQISALRYTHPNGGLALDQLDLDVHAGERLALIGPNGAGKTTLLLHLNGLLRGTGTVRIFGLEVQPANLREIRRRVGMVFQSPDDQLFCPTLFEDVAFGPRNLGVPEAEIEKRVQSALEQVGLAGSEKQSPFHLSLGEKRRAALATVLAMHPRILVLDEPSSNLDPKGKRDLAALLNQMPQTLLIATHDLEFARNTCSRVAVMCAGKIAAQGPLPHFLQNPATLEQYGL